MSSLFIPLYCTHLKLFLRNVSSNSLKEKGYTIFISVFITFSKTLVFFLNYHDISNLKNAFYNALFYIEKPLN